MGRDASEQPSETWAVPLLTVGVDPSGPNPPAPGNERVAGSGSQEGGSPPARPLCHFCVALLLEKGVRSAPLEMGAGDLGLVVCPGFSTADLSLSGSCDNG